MPQIGAPVKVVYIGALDYKDLYDNEETDENTIYFIHPVDPASGSTYAILLKDQSTGDYTGKMMFIRSTDSYTSGTTGTAVDIFENEYYGVILPFSLDSSESKPWTNSTYRDNIEEVECAEGQVFPVSNSSALYMFFKQCSNLSIVDLSGFKLDDSISYNLAQMFYSTSIVSVDMNDWGWADTKISSCNSMFSHCTTLEEAIMSNLIFENTDLTGMFNPGSGTDTQPVTLIELPTINITAGSSISTQAMFRNCNLLETVKLEFNFNGTGTISSSANMFVGCDVLWGIYTNTDWAGHITSGSNMFSGCYNLRGQAGTEYGVSLVADKTYAVLDGVNNNPGYLIRSSVQGNIVVVQEKSPTTYEYTGNLIFMRTNEDPLNIESGQTRSILDINGAEYYGAVFADDVCAQHHAWNLDVWSDYQYITAVYVADGNEIGLSTTDDEFGGIFEFMNPVNLFTGLTNLTNVDFSGFYVTTSAQWTSAMYSEELLDMSGMFAGCTSLEEISFDGLCGSVTGVGSGLVNIINAESTFWGCTSLESADFTGLRLTSSQGRAFSGQYMFSGCSALQSVTFDSSGVTASGISGADVTLAYMFENCTSLVELNMHMYGTPDGTIWFGAMFEGCSALETIYTNVDWFSYSSDQHSQNMFNGCIHLVGGNGTTYNSNYIDRNRAYIDTAAHPGYLTQASNT